MEHENYCYVKDAKWLEVDQLHVQSFYKGGWGFELETIENKSSGASGLQNRHSNRLATPPLWIFITGIT